MKFISLLAATLFVLSAYGQDSTESSSWLSLLKAPLDISVEGHRVDSLITLTTYLIIFFFVIVCIGLFGFSYYYSQKRHPVPLYIDGTSKKHILIVAFIGSLVFVLIDMQITSISNNDYMEVFNKWPDENKEEVVKVEVLGQQWAWNFRYAGADGIFNTEDDVVTLNDLRVPTGKKVVFQITSKDVIHAFSIPNVRLKVDAIPGRITRMWTEFTKPGDYSIACTEMCGTYHYRMQAKLKVYDPNDFANWLAESHSNTKHIVDQENPDIFWGWKWIVTTQN